MQRLQILEILYIDYKITMVILFKQIKRWPWKYLRETGNSKKKCCIFVKYLLKIKNVIMKFKILSILSITKEWFRRKREKHEDRIFEEILTAKLLKFDENYWYMQES